MPLADLSRIRLRYELTGDSARPVLVLSNSLGANLDMWAAQVDALAGHFRLLRYDTRGHGKSSIPAGPYSVADLGGDVLNLLDRLGIVKASFCGISMGGLTGQWLAVNAPGRLDKLVLANTAAKIGTAAIWDARIATVIANGLHPIVQGTIERWFTPQFREAESDIVEVTAATLAATDPQGYAACCAAIRDADFRSGLASFTVPTLVISGSHDPVTPPSDGQFLAQHISGSRFLELAAAHLSNMEAADAFNEAVLDFLRTA